MAYDRKQGEHHVTQSSRPDYRVAVGRAEVAVGAPRIFAVLEPARAATLKAWTSTLIPAQGKRPDAGSVGAAEYIDATVLAVPSIRAQLLHGIDEVERLARATTGGGFVDCAAEARENILRQFQAADESDAFDMVSDFTYEAYYGHREVLAAIEVENGWPGTAPMSGSVMTPFDPGRLARVRSRPPHFLVVPAAKRVEP